ncbi:MAG: hypothetical protein P8L37_05905 [Phycisphaerales bacterium]|nr:hypothetical protein [Phycisphaerales bacterium]
MRVTIGHMLVAAAVILVLLIGTWMLAYRQGELRARADLQSAIFQPVSADPLAASTSPALVPVPVAGEQARLLAPGLQAPEDAELYADPREAGFFYFVLAETRPEGALRLARFCRERGLETWLIPRDTVGLVQVLATPGLPSATRGDPLVIELDDQIGEIGRAWKRAGGHSSLEDRYLVRGD